MRSLKVSLVASLSFLLTTSCAVVHVYDRETDSNDGDIQGETGEETIGDDSNGDELIHSNDAGPRDESGDPNEDATDDEGDGTCVEPCGACTFGVDECCDHSVCQDDWSGETRCMPVVPPHSGLCPTSPPTPGDTCEAPGLLCRYDGQFRCKCGCDGWNCPYDG